MVLGRVALIRTILKNLTHQMWLDFCPPAPYILRQLEHSCAEIHPSPFPFLLQVYKKRKHDKDSRMATVMEGREGREKFGSKKKEKAGPSTATHKEKAKKKVRIGRLSVWGSLKGQNYSLFCRTL